MSTRRALVVGGGIGGLAAAIGLRRAGWEVEVLERAPAIQAVGAGLSLWGNALRALAELGLRERVMEIAHPPTDGGIFLPDGRPLMSFSGAEVRARFGELMVAVHRADLQAALLEALGPDGLRSGAELARFEQDARGVTAHLADGSTARGAVLIGADGLRSTVRAELHGAAPPRYAGYTAWRGVVDFPHPALLPGETWGAGARFGRVALTGGRAYWFATRNEPEGGRGAEGEKAELLRTFSGWHAPIPALIEATPGDGVLRNDIYDRPPLRRWGAGRVTLLGDAAHPMTPNLGQGACQALEDAAALVRCLAEADDAPAALRRYESERAPRANAFVRQSRDVGRIGQWQNPLAVAARSWLARNVLSRLQMRQFARLAEAGA